MWRSGFVLLAVTALAACQIGSGAGPSDAPKGGLIGDAVEVTTLAPLPDALETAPPAAKPEDGEGGAEANPEGGESAKLPPAEEAPAEPLPAEVPPAEQPAAEQPAAEPGPPAEPQSPAQIACLKGGGVWSKAQSGAAFCQRMTKDGGKSCTKAGDCEGYCLAPSRSCAPVTPVFGCYEILDELGRAITECVE